MVKPPADLVVKPDDQTSTPNPDLPQATTLREHGEGLEMDLGEERAVGCQARLDARSD